MSEEAKFKLFPESKADTQDHLKIFDEFIDTTGWKIFEGRLKMVIEAYTDEVMNAATSDERTMAVGKVRALKMMLKWPEIHAKGCQEALEREALAPGSQFIVKDDIDTEQ